MKTIDLGKILLITEVPKYSHYIRYENLNLTMHQTILTEIIYFIYL